MSPTEPSSISELNLFLFYIHIALLLPLWKLHLSQCVCHYLTACNIPDQQICTAVGTKLVPVSDSVVDCLHLAASSLLVQHAELTCLWPLTWKGKNKRCLTFIEIHSVLNPSDLNYSFLYPSYIIKYWKCIPSQCLLFLVCKRDKEKMQLEVFSEGEKKIIQAPLQILLCFIQLPRWDACWKELSGTLARGAGRLTADFFPLPLLLQIHSPV